MVGSQQLELIGSNDTRTTYAAARPGSVQRQVFLARTAHRQSVVHHDVACRAQLHVAGCCGGCHSRTHRDVAGCAAADHQPSCSDAIEFTLVQTQHPRRWVRAHDIRAAQFYRTTAGGLDTDSPIAASAHT